MLHDTTQVEFRHGIKESRRNTAPEDKNLSLKLLTMVGSNIIIRKQLEKTSNDQIIKFVVKLQENMITKQNKLFSENKEITVQIN